MNGNTKFSLLLTNFTKTYIAVFYNTSVIFALIERKKEKEITKSIKHQIKEEKMPLLNRKNFTQTKWNEFSDTYLMKTQEEVICENARNYELRYSDVEAIKLSPYKTHSAREYESSSVLGQIWINTYSKKYHFNHKYIKQDTKVNLLQECFVDRFVLLK